MALSAKWVRPHRPEQSEAGAQAPTPFRRLVAEVIPLHVPGPHVEFCAAVAAALDVGEERKVRRFVGAHGQVVVAEHALARIDIHTD